MSNPQWWRDAMKKRRQDAGREYLEAIRKGTYKPKTTVIRIAKKYGICESLVRRGMREVQAAEGGR